MKKLIITVTVLASSVFSYSHAQVTQADLAEAFSNVVETQQALRDARLQAIVDAREVTTVAGVLELIDSYKEANGEDISAQLAALASLYELADTYATENGIETPRLDFIIEQYGPILGELATRIQAFRDNIETYQDLIAAAEEISSILQDLRDYQVGDGIEALIRTLILLDELRNRDSV